MAGPLDTALCLHWTHLFPGTKRQICLHMACGHSKLIILTPQSSWASWVEKLIRLSSDHSIGWLWVTWTFLNSLPLLPYSSVCRGTQALRLGNILATDLDMHFRYSKHFTLIIPWDIFTYPLIQPRQIVRHLAKSHRECYWECRAEPQISITLGQWSFLLQVNTVSQTAWCYLRAWMHPGLGPLENSWKYF